MNQFERKWHLYYLGLPPLEDKGCPEKSNRCSREVTRAMKVVEFLEVHYGTFSQDLFKKLYLFLLRVQFFVHQWPSEMS